VLLPSMTQFSTDVHSHLQSYLLPVSEPPVVLLDELACFWQLQPHSHAGLDVNLPLSFIHSSALGFHSLVLFSIHSFHKYFLSSH
jgi:hypothetical protein